MVVNGLAIWWSRWTTTKNRQPPTVAGGRRSQLSFLVRHEFRLQISSTLPATSGIPRASNTLRTIVLAEFLIEAEIAKILISGDTRLASIQTAETLRYLTANSFRVQISSIHPSFKRSDRLRQELAGCRQISNIRTDTSHGAPHSCQRDLD